MRALILSDIHANLQALEAVLAAAPAHDTVWNLGDTVGYGANPNETVKIAQELHGIEVRGNHDRACSGIGNLDNFSHLAAAAAQWTQRELSEPNRQWLRQLVPGPLDVQSAGVSCVHGSPLEEDEYLLELEDALVSLELTPARITFFGHTHRQGGFATNGENVFTLRPQYGSHNEPESYELPLRQGARYLLNPGSVGQPRDGDWRAAFALYDAEQSLVIWYRVPYNAAEAQRRIRDAGLPDFLADRLSSGR